jgi:hypothetical protein
LIYPRYFLDRHLVLVRTLASLVDCDVVLSGSILSYTMSYYVHHRTYTPSPHLCLRIDAHTSASALFSAFPLFPFSSVRLSPRSSRNNSYLETFHPDYSFDTRQSMARPSPFRTPSFRRSVSLKEGEGVLALQNLHFSFLPSPVPAFGLIQHRTHALSERTIHSTPLFGATPAIQPR